MAAKPEMDLEGGGFRRATISYLVALAIIATLGVGTYHLTDAIVVEQADTAKVINVAGRQRMLSQRAAMLALDIARTENAVLRTQQENDLSATLSEMAKAHEALSRGEGDKAVFAPKSKSEMAIYRDDPHRLDARVREFIDQGTVYLALPVDQRKTNPALSEMLVMARKPILDALDAAVAQREINSRAEIAGLRRTMLVTLLIMLATLIIEHAVIFRPMFKHLRMIHRQLIDMAWSDALTGAMNRRHFSVCATREIVRARRNGQALAVMMLDVDRFKKINDTWGHAIGDEAIRTLARTLLQSLRRTDLLGRIGGEEFAIMLPNTSADAALLVAEKLRLQVASTPVNTSNITFQMTVSIGITELLADDNGVAAVFERADQALYRAKKAGRNCVCAPEPPLSTPPIGSAGKAGAGLAFP